MPEGLCSEALEWIIGYFVVSLKAAVPQRGVLALSHI